MEQFMAEDKRGSGILMYAAKGNDDLVYKTVCTMYKLESTADAWPYQVTHFDHTGRTMLHHAAESGSFGVLQEVVKLLLEYSDGDRLHASADHKGRTPIMHVLRNRFRRPGGDIKRKVDLLYRKTTEDDWLAMRPIRPRDKVRGQKAVGTTELMHAAQGGPESLSHTLDKIRGLRRSNVVDLAGILSMGFVPTTEGDSDDENAKQLGKPWMDYRPDYHGHRLYTWGCGMLLAAAAKGGSVEVLEKVVSAVEVSCYTHNCSRAFFDWSLFREERILTLLHHSLVQPRVYVLPRSSVLTEKAIIGVLTLNPL